MEQKVKCPCYLQQEDSCFLEKTDEGFESYLCFDCGFTTNSVLKIDTDECKEHTKHYTALVQDLKIVDEERGLEWYPSVINMGPLGLIYPDGTQNLWNWRVAKVKPIPEDERHNYPKEDGSGDYETFLDIHQAESYQKHEFVQACEELGITQFVNRGKVDK